MKNPKNPKPVDPEKELQSAVRRLNKWCEVALGYIDDAGDTHASRGLERALEDITRILKNNHPQTK